MTHDPQPNADGRWYRDIDPREHTYTTGYGFSPRPPEVMEQRLIARHGMAAGTALLGFFFVGNLSDAVLLRLFDLLFPPDGNLAFDELLYEIADAIGMIGAIVIPFLFYGLFCRIPAGCAMPARRVPSGLLFPAVLIGLGVSVVGLRMADELTLLLEQLGISFYSVGYSAPESPAALVLYMLNLTLLPALLEEIAFRGVLMQSLRRFGDGFALLASAVLFAAVHVIPTRFPYAFVMGLLLGYVVLLTGSLTSSIIIHLVYNLLITLMDLLPYEVQGFVWSVGCILCLLGGIVAAVWLMRRYSGMFQLRRSAAVNSEGIKLRSFFCTLPMLAFAVVILVMAAGYLML